MTRILDLEYLVAQIPDGAKIAIPREFSGAPMAAVREILRRGTKNLHLVAIPTVGLTGDLLIGAGCVSIFEGAAVSLGEYGPAPRFVEAAREGTIKLMDATCPAVYGALQAAEKGLPFIPLRGILGSDVLKHRPDWKTIDNPFGPGGDPIVLIPAIVPDIALIHVPKADRKGNVWVGVHRELMTAAHAARKTLATVEEIVEGDLLADEAMAPGTIPSLYVTAVAEAKRGAWPLAGPNYGEDGDHLRAYAREARTKAGFAAYLDAQVFGRREAA